MSPGQRGIRVTISDVARLAGVSNATVSFVLNEKPGGRFSQETRQRVLAAIDALGYRPNALARTLSAGSSRFIGVVSDAIATTPFAGQLIQGAQDEAWRNGYVLLIANTGGDRAVEERALGMLLEHQVAGILYSTWYHRRTLSPYLLKGVPHVLANCFSDDPTELAVVPDEVQGGRSATRLLLERGHRRVAFLNSVEDAPATVGRLKGYREALAQFDIPFEHELVLEVGHDQESGFAGISRLLELQHRPTAVFCYNDRVAMGAFDALRCAGLEVPDDVAIVGFDNQEVIAAHLRPPLTTVGLPHYEIGARAVQVLLSQGTGSGDGAVHVVACPEIVRASV